MRCTNIIRFLPAVILGLLILSPGVRAQEIPIGAWRAHISYNSIHRIAFGNNTVYAASDNGVMVFDRSEGSVTTYNKINGLSSSGITSLAYADQYKYLLVGYEDGNLNIILDGVVSVFDRLKNSAITGSKRINSIVIHNALAYLSTDYGIVVFDLQKREVKETWRDLGSGGATVRVFQSTFLNDSIFAATSNGVLAGDLGDNLLDFNLWKRFNTGEFSTSVRAIATFNSKIYASLNAAGIRRYETGSWTQVPFLQTVQVNSLEGSPDNLVIVEGQNVWRLSAMDQLAQITDQTIEDPLTAREDASGKLWIGDAKHGLVSNFTGGFTSVLPNGPTVSAYRLTYEDKLYAFAGGPSASYQPRGNAGHLNTFQKGIWQNAVQNIADLTDAEVTPESLFISSFGYGLQQTDASGATTLFDETNSPLTNLNPPGRFVNITAIESSTDGLWVANYGATQSLRLIKSDNTWESFSFPITASRYPVDIVVDTYGYVWMILNPSQGGGLLVFDYAGKRHAYLTNAAGSGALPSKSVRSLAVDRDGYVWAGTDEGVAYFVYPPDVFSTGGDAIKPIYENRFLLKDDRVTALIVDGGNRKWMGTERGVWLFNPTGEVLIYNFTATSSPLLSNVIRDMAIEPLTGEVFFATDGGLVSFRSGASSGESFFQNVKIFPNPVTKEFSGTVGISGLATDAVVKITDVSGKLIWQTNANGGTATWNVQDYKGRRAATGIYLVFAATPDGSEKVVGKVAVVD